MNAFECDGLTLLGVSTEAILRLPGTERCDSVALTARARSDRLEANGLESR
jgi:hypothetical protein